jgi:hypothetical protein
MMSCIFRGGSCISVPGLVCWLKACASSRTGVLLADLKGALAQEQAVTAFREDARRHGKKGQAPQVR